MFRPQLNNTFKLVIYKSDHCIYKRGLSQVQFLKESNLYYYKSPTCKSQVQNTSRMSLVNIEYDMSSSSEEELDELLKRHMIRRPRKFEERRLFDV